MSEIIDDSKIKEIERLIWESLLRKFRLILDAVLYDTTNFYTYHSPSTGNSLAQYGKSKEKRDDKRLVGLQLAILKDLGIPIFHTVYSGHIHDASIFPTAISRLIERYREAGGKTERLVLIFDKGNNSSGNIEHVEKSGIAFVGSLVPSHHRDLLLIPLEHFTEISGGVKAYRTTRHVFGSKKTIVITYNEKRARRDEHIFEKQLQETVKETREFFETVKNEPTEVAYAKVITFLRMKKIGTSQALRFFSVKVWHNGWVNKLRIRRKRTEVSYKKAAFGKTILFTNLHDESTEYIVSQYRSAHRIEDAFRHLKDRDLVSYYPAYHWTDSKIRVHAFVCVLALLLIKLLYLIANREGMEVTTTLLIEELQDIQEVILVYPNRRAVRTISHMSTVQKKLFQIYGLDKYT
ncbi:IS1634 family transposase [Thermodesulforhabdus norvegica]|uniref:IS1634 family transposase n=1 Tax=Thermodesulforhabdus norvegica TaxID=39841 RepID=UPI003CCBAAAA